MLLVRFLLHSLLFIMKLIGKILLLPALVLTFALQLMATLLLHVGSLVDM